MPSDKPGAGIRSFQRPPRQRTAIPLDAYQQTVSRLAARCRALYVGVRVRLSPDKNANFDRPIASWDGGRDSNGRRHRPVWERMAQLFLERGIDPVLFMQAQVNRGSILPPAALVGEKAVAKYHAFIVEEAANIRNRLQLETLEARLAYGARSRAMPDLNSLAVWRGVLHDDSLEISPLWRFCAAVAEGLPDIVQELHDAALDQYLAFTAAYDQHWQCVLPERLKQEAQQIRHAAGVGQWQQTVERVRDN